jgi:lactoylglutathione lyase
MRGKIGSVTVLADDALRLVKFYCETLGFSVKSAHNDYVELENDGVRFAVCSRSTMEGVTGHPSYGEAKCGQMFTLAFLLRTHQEVDETFADVVAKGAVPVQSPKTMPWGQRAAFFADPEGNIHELLAELPRPAECYS